MDQVDSDITREDCHYDMPSYDILGEEQLECIKVHCLPHDELRKKVLANNLEMANLHGVSPHQLLPPIDCQEEDRPNMFFFAIRNKKYHSAITILHCLHEQEGVSHILTAEDAEGNNCLQILISNCVNQPQARISLATKMSTEERQPTEKDVIKLLGGFECFNQLTMGKTKSGDTAIVWAVKNKGADIARDLLDVLSDDQKWNTISKIEECARDCKGNKHGETCKRGYNLLMLALDVENVHGPLIDHILNIVSESDEVVKTDIAMGKNKPGVFSESENSIRLAAKRRQINYLRRLLKECVPHAQMYDALLEVGPCGKSAIGYLLDADDIGAIANPSDLNVAEDDQFPEKLTVKQTEAIKNSESINIFRKSLEDPAKLKNFLQSEMSQKAIEFFYNIRLFRKQFLIPKPSDKSRPKALIFHNTDFTNLATLDHSRMEAQAMIEALEYLGWEEGMIFYNHEDWTFEKLKLLLGEQIEAVKTSCSLLFLCVTSHGSAGQICGCDGTPGKIADVIAITSKIPPCIPKILIFDMCKGENFDAPGIQPAIKANNIHLLSATVYGEQAEPLQYMPQLADEMGDADGRSFQDMHIAAAANVYGSTGQIPHMEMTGLSIYLRKYDQKDSHCAKCNKDIREKFKDCLICNRCYHWYHLKCLNLNSNHKDLCSVSTFLWLCKPCYNKWHQI